LERLKMRREGHLRTNIYFKLDDQGQPIWNDTYEYAILKDEWLGQNS
jgi:RimJ/RimL family protein N-acetyltransferase